MYGRLDYRGQEAETSNRTDWNTGGPSPVDLYDETDWSLTGETADDRPSDT